MANIVNTFLMNGTTMGIFFIIFFIVMTIAIVISMTAGKEEKEKNEWWILITVTCFNISLVIWFLYEYFVTYQEALNEEHPLCPTMMCDTKDTTVFKCGSGAFRYDPDEDPNVFYCSGRDQDQVRKYKI